MNKKRKEYIKKINIFKKQLKKNLSILKKHIYNYKLEISFSILVVVVIFLISLLYLSSNLVEEDVNDNNFVEDLSSTENEKQDIDEYLADINKQDIDDSEDYDSSSDNVDENSISIEFDNNKENERQQEEQQREEVDLSENDLTKAFINSFGDSFYSGVYLNPEETNMYLDDISTALTFKPLYNFSKLGSCGGGESTCDFKKNVRILDYGMRACINETNDCLWVVDKDLYYNGRKITLPQEINNEEIISLTVGVLDTKFLLGAVLPKGEDEYGLVYLFDGNNFENIISKNSKHTIRSKYQRQGGRIGFGGSDNNFLILYAGYRGQAFQVYNGELTDISHMFGLRVINEGFMPQIIQSGSGNDSTWYVCSLDKKNPKFVKLWQNGSKYIQGSLDLTFKIYSTSELYDNFNHCYLSGNDKSKVYLTFGDNNNLDIWQFDDNGFDNSHDYSVVSSDILYKEGHLAKNAIIREVSLSVSEEKYTNNINDYGDLYLSTDNFNWHNVDVGSVFKFQDLSSDLYWRLDLKKGGNDYFSPWFDSINRLNYFLLNKD